MSVESQIRQQAMALGVPADLAVAVARRESGLDQSAMGSSGEVGIFQIMPGTAAGLGIDPYDAGENILGGVTYLKQQYNTFGSWDLALAAYNAGPGRVAAGTIPASTQSYVSSILGVQPTVSYAGMPTFSTTVWGEPAGGLPWWVLPLGVLVMVLALRRRRG